MFPFISSLSPSAFALYGASLDFLAKNAKSKHPPVYTCLHEDFSDEELPHLGFFLENFFLFFHSDNENVNNRLKNWAIYDGEHLAEIYMQFFHVFALYTPVGRSRFSHFVEELINSHLSFYLPYDDTKDFNENVESFESTLFSLCALCEKMPAHEFNVNIYASICGFVALFTSKDFPDKEAAIKQFRSQLDKFSDVMAA